MTFAEKGHNPNCGDEIELQIKLDGDKIADMAFTGHGCAISQSSTSIMIDVLKGKNNRRSQENNRNIYKYDKKRATNRRGLKKIR